MKVAEIAESLVRYITKKYGDEFQVLSCEKVGKNFEVILDFGEGEKLGVSIRERKGGNGNYRVDGEWDASDEEEE